MSKEANRASHTILMRSYVLAQELDSMILMAPLQLRIFYNSIILSSQKKSQLPKTKQHPNTRSPNFAQPPTDGICRKMGSITTNTKPS